MTALRGKRILVVEDEPLVAMMVEDMLLDLGAVVVGPAATLESALKLVELHAFDAALLDVNLNGQLSRPVADQLTVRGIPFVFATGYDVTGLEGHKGVEVIRKPYNGEQVAASLLRIIPR